VACHHSLDEYLDAWTQPPASAMTRRGLYSGRSKGRQAVVRSEIINAANDFVNERDTTSSVTDATWKPNTEPALQMVSL
jgi:hypothetical protein